MICFPKDRSSQIGLFFCNHGKYPPVILAISSLFPNMQTGKLLKQIMNIYITFYKSVFTDKIQRKNIIVSNNADRLLAAADILADKTDYYFFAYQVKIDKRRLQDLYDAWYNPDVPPFIQENCMCGVTTSGIYEGFSIEPVI